MRIITDTKGSSSSASPREANTQTTTTASSSSSSSSGDAGGGHKRPRAPAAARSSKRGLPNLPAHLELVAVPGDGNCLFRALALQIFGDQSFHTELRAKAVAFMERNREAFESFVGVVGGENWEEYLERKARDGVYGNNIEIQAISELFNRPIYIFTPTSSTPINTFHSDYTDPPLYVVYYAASEHYDALLNHARPSIGLGLGLPGMKVGGGEESIMKEVGGKSDVAHSEEIMRKKALALSELEGTEESIVKEMMKSSAKEYDGYTYEDAYADDDLLAATLKASSRTSGQPDPPSPSQTVDQAPPIVQELVMNGFDFSKCMKAYDLVGDDFDGILEVVQLLED
eukprot:CAMPEP_0197549124 /NCGR_PEP_ID=MMETSP1320-20131121/3095_1 /TAXON_ID=91990 /ORGANISM="Bolidomonas sp., Strain RCC2347" /LENGTH=342 /DNA_ID=CAMNT_0043109289 /DNA_START=23 /DNA_END=1051 /DNA_ORIENTATION=+